MMSNSQSIQIVYQLSQSAQKDAWLEVDVPTDSARLPVAANSRLQIRLINKLTVNQETWDEATELVWIAPNGIPVLFVGGLDAFEPSDYARGWIYVDGTVPGKWACTPNFTVSGTVFYQVERLNEPPLRVDRYDVSIDDLIELESNRLYEIQQSKIKADAEDEKRDTERKEKSALMTSMLFKAVRS